MDKFIVWLGYFILAFGFVLFSPLSDFLPINLWFLIENYLTGKGENEHRAYMRVTKNTGDVPSVVWLGLIIAAAGLALIALGYYLGARE